MNLISLDIGKRKTGIAFYNEETQVPIPLDTIIHDSDEALIEAIEAEAEERAVNTLILGLPLLPSSEEGSQVKYVRNIAEMLKIRGFQIEFVDERYTTPKKPLSDGNIEAALAILNTYLSNN